MPTISDFAQLLDEALRPDDRRSAVLSAAAPRFSSAHPLIFATPYPTTRSWRQASVQSLSDADRAARRQVQRQLSAGGEESRAALNRLGAGLASDFTKDELRRAYRGLARGFHPDRHRQSLAGDQRFLTETFADINTHHRRLRRALSNQV